MTHASTRHLARTLTLLCLAASGTTVATAAPAAAEPTVGEAKQKVERLSHQRTVVKRRASSLEKRLVDAKVDLRTTRTEISAYRGALDDVQSRLERLESAEGAAIGRALSAAATVTTAPDQEGALAEVQSEIAEDLLAPEVERRISDRLDELESSEASQEARVAALGRRYKAAGHRLDDVRSSVRRAVAALDEARASRSAERTAAPAASAASGAGAAVAYAMAQVGDAYVYGAAGPDAFDCSGLTMMAWSQAGVALPHSSGAQMGSGTPVSSSALQPGDLVFYYSPVSHVGIYVGNGQIVHAANPSTGVRLDPVASMPISGAVRPG